MTHANPRAPRPRTIAAVAVALGLAVSSLSIVPIAATAAPAAQAAPAASGVHAAAPTTLDRTGWSATASSEGFGYPVGHLLDGNDGTLWSTGNGQTPGQWLRVDLGSVRQFDTIELGTGSATSDYARQYSVTTSSDGVTWSAPITGSGSVTGTAMLIPLGTVSARYVRVEQTSGHFINAWSVSEFRLTLADTTPDFGPNVIIFDETTDPALIQSTMDDLADDMRTAEFSDRRTSILFKPGTYSVDSEVNYYTTVAGLGLLPGDVTVTGDIRVEGRVNNPAEFWVDDALVNFWRSLENLTIDPADGESRWAVSQASPMRRVHIEGDLQLSPQYFGYSSGGYLADSKVDGLVTSGSQQQWFTRNSTVGSWSGSVWNQVFSGVTNAPATTHPTPPITNVGPTAVSREKPFLYIDDSGEYQVFVPSLQHSSSGTSWEDGSAPGSSISINDFFIAKPTDSAATINAALATGKNLLLTPGIYELDDALQVSAADTVVLGLGIATLVPLNGDAAIEVADVSGVRLAGFMVDAGPVRSDVLIQLGASGGVDHAADPTSVQDVYVRIGGARAGSATTSLEVNSDDVLIDHIWMWRADHGAGAGWTTNVGDHGLVVNGDDVSAYGLMVEHYEKNQVLWNGEAGRTVFYQSEIPYDPPTQAAWMDGTRNGYASYRVADSVTTHEASGLGVYSYFNQGVDITLESAIQVPQTPGVVLNSLVSVFLAGSGSIAHTVNDQGTVVGTGTPMTSYVSRYPAPDSAACATPGVRSTWTATASSSGFGYPTTHLFDDNAATAWSTGSGQTPGQWLLVDLGCTETFEAIELAVGSATSDYARSYAVTVSSNGSSFSAPVTGTGSVVDGVMTIPLGATSARYVRIEQTSGHFINAWSVAEFRLVTDDYSTYSPVVFSSASMVAPAESFTISGSGFAPTETVSISGAGATVTATADADGTFAQPLSIPGAVARGAVDFVIVGSLTARSTTVSVLLRDAGSATDEDPNENACPDVTGAPPETVTPSTGTPVAATGAMPAPVVTRGFTAVEVPTAGDLFELQPEAEPSQDKPVDDPEGTPSTQASTAATPQSALSPVVVWAVGGALGLVLVTAIGLLAWRRRGLA